MGITGYLAAPLAYGQWMLGALPLPLQKWWQSQMSPDITVTQGAKSVLIEDRYSNPLRWFFPWIQKFLPVLKMVGTQPKTQVKPSGSLQNILFFCIVCTSSILLCKLQLHSPPWWPGNPQDVLSHFSHVWLFVTLWIVACQAPLSVGFYRQEYWSGLPCPPPWDLPDPGIEPRSPILQAESLPLSHWESLFSRHHQAFFFPSLEVSLSFFLFFKLMSLSLEKCCFIYLLWLFVVLGGR